MAEDQASRFLEQVANHESRSAFGSLSEPIRPGLIPGRFGLMDERPVAGFQREPPDALRGSSAKCQSTPEGSTT